MWANELAHALLTDYTSSVPKHYALQNVTKWLCVCSTSIVSKWNHIALYVRKQVNQFKN